MQGKRADGRSSTAAAASPNTAKTALEALLTCEGLEKDPDLEAEVAYITSRQNAPSTAATAGGASAQVGQDSVLCWKWMASSHMDLSFGNGCVEMLWERLMLY